MTPQRIPDRPKIAKESVMRKCDTGACVKVDPQPDGSVVVYSTNAPDVLTPFTAEEWVAHEEELKAQGRAEAIADLRDRDAYAKWEREGDADPNRFFVAWADRRRCAIYLEAQTKPAEVGE